MKCLFLTPGHHATEFGNGIWQRNLATEFGNGIWSEALKRPA